VIVEGSTLKPALGSESGIPIVAKVEISPEGFTLGIKAELENIFSICPKLLINAELYGLLLTPRLERGYHRLWEANLRPLGPMFSAFISNLGPNNKPKMLKGCPKDFQP
jgi:hypothetical protein